MLLWLAQASGQPLTELRLSPGEPVRLWIDAARGDDVEQGVVTRLSRGRLGVIVGSDYREFLEQGRFHLDREAPEVTFDRGDRALALVRDAAREGAPRKWRTLLFGEAAPKPASGPAELPRYFDAGLNLPQRCAVAFALAAPDLALVHGPPGTGKTRTLVEIVRQALARGERVLVTAASNTAVDNLAERLLDAGVTLLRLGHPARVSEAVEASTLDARVEGSAQRKLAKRAMADANDLRRRYERRRARGTLDYHEGRQLLAEARRLQREAREQMDLARKLVLAESRVVCVTAAGADSALLGELAFDRVVLDEATQAVDPIALAALVHAERAVLAGDPCQLPPTVLDATAAREGLSSTFFERLAARHGERVVRMLEVQYRMHRDLMRFPSESMYEGRLVAADEVASHTLPDLPGARADALRPGPLVFIDTAGMGYGEEKSDDDPSTRNPEQAERVVREVMRLAARGVAARDIAVIAPYDAQVRLLRELLAVLVAQGLEVGSVDGFQGREKEAVVLDLVRSNEAGDLGFLCDARRMNVALTRARRFLLVVGDGATLSHVEYYRRFMQAADELGATRSAFEDDGT